MIKILQVLGGLNYGGVSSAIMNFYRKLDKTEFHCDFTTTSRGGRWESEIKANGGDIFLLPSRSKHPFKYYKELKRVIKNGNYDIVHSNSNSASCYLDLRAAKKAGCKIRLAHSHNSSCGVKWQHYIFKPFLNRVTTHRLACSKPAAAWLFGNKDCTILNNGIDFDKFMFDEAIRKKVRCANQWEDSFVIGHIGTLCDRKNQRFLIELMPKILERKPNALLVLIGSGESLSELEELSTELCVRNNVKFVGNSNNVNELLQGFDLFCFPSIYEGLGIAYIEAAVSGLRVIISDSIPYANIGDNIKVLPLDSAAWLNEIYSMSSLPPRITFTEQQRLNSCYDINYIVKELEDFYRRALLNS